MSVLIQPVIATTRASLGLATTDAPTFAGLTVPAGAIVQESWIGPALQNSWVNYGAGLANAGYAKDSQGYVTLRGVLKDGTTTAGILLFTLPVGYRPTGREFFMVMTNATSAARIDVLADGTVEAYAASAAALSLSGVRFSVA